MAITVKHSKVSTIPDDADTSLVRPSDWNADHTLVGLGTMAEQNANNVAITGGSITGVTGVGTVTSVGGTGTVNGVTLTGTVTSSGNLTLGGTLDLSSPPTIGNTAPNTGKFTTLEATGTSSLGTTSTTYVTITGDASYPMVKAAGGTNTPLVLSPLGTGALQAQRTDSAAAGGNARGANAVDWQTSRGAAINVASGAQSVVGGGGSNGSTGQYSGVLSGVANSSTGFATLIAGGWNNSATGGNSAILGGYLNTVGGSFNVIGGGANNSGTANASVTTQATTAVTSGSTAVTLSASNASIKVGQLITGTGIVTFTYVAAISGTTLTLSQNANTTGTPTLTFFTPHGVVVGGGNNQATGSYSFIGGGGDAGTAANRNTASGDWSTVGGGKVNLASGSYAFIGGGSGNQATGNGSVVAGGGTDGTFFVTNSATASFSTVSGGWGNQATSTASTVAGGSYGTTRSINGNFVTPACNSPIGAATGVSQSAILILGRQTTDATATVLCSNGAAASGTNQVTLPNNSAYYFKGSVIAGKTGAGDTKGWTIEGVIKRGANAASTAIVGTATVVSTYADAGAATWALTATADTTNGALAITFTGQAATTIRVVAKVETTEMTF
jgi:hypothetical protein